MELSGALLEGVVDRLTRPDYRAFEAQLRSSGFCARQRSRRRVPLRAKVAAALQTVPDREGIVFPSAGGGRIEINNFRSREWVPALKLPASSTAASTTCATPSPRGASRRA